MTLHSSTSSDSFSEERWEFCAYLPITLLRENNICFLPTRNSCPVWEREDMETENLLMESESSL